MFTNNQIFKKSKKEFLYKTISNVKNVAKSLVGDLIPKPDFTLTDETKKIIVYKLKRLGFRKNKWNTYHYKQTDKNNFELIVKFSHRLTLFQIYLLNLNTFKTFELSKLKREELFYEISTFRLANFEKNLEDYITLLKNINN